MELRDPDPTPSEPRRADARRNSAAILAAAGTVLADDPSASMQAIANAAGVSRMSVVRRYPTRADLIAGLIEQKLDEALDRIREARASHPPGRDAVHAAIEGLLDAARGYPVLLTLPEDVIPPADASRIASLRAELDQLLTDAVAAGDIRSDVPVATMRALIAGGLRAMTVTDASNPGGPRGADLSSALLDGLFRR